MTTTPSSGAVVAMDGFVATIDGRQILVPRGKVFEATDPAVVARPDVFLPLPASPADRAAWHARRRREREEKIDIREAEDRERRRREALTVAERARERVERERERLRVWNS